MNFITECGVVGGRRAAAARLHGALVGLCFVVCVSDRQSVRCKRPRLLHSQDFSGSYVPCELRWGTRRGCRENAKGRERLR